MGIRSNGRFRGKTLFEKMMRVYIKKKELKVIKGVRQVLTGWFEVELFL